MGLIQVIRDVTEWKFNLTVIETKIIKVLGIIAVFFKYPIYAHTSDLVLLDGRDEHSRRIVGVT